MYRIYKPGKIYSYLSLIIEFLNLPVPVIFMKLIFGGVGRSVWEAIVYDFFASIYFYFFWMIFENS